MSNINFRMMKTNRLLKITLSIAVLAFLSTNVVGQTYPGNLINSGIVASPEDSVTGGVAIPYFVYPDPVLNSNFSEPYDPTTNPAPDLNPDERWDWFFLPSGPGGTFGTQGYDGNGTQEGPYIPVTWNAPGNADGSPAVDSIYVRERNTNGSCVGDTSILGVRVFDPPAFTPVANDGTQNTDPEIEVCGTQYYDIQMSSITDNHVNTGILKIMLDISVDSVSASAPFGSSEKNWRSEGDTVVYYDDGGGPTTPVNADNNDETAVSLFNGGYYVTPINGGVTRYTFSFGGSDDGISDQVSRKSDYLSVGGTDAGAGPGNDQNWNYYTATDGGDGTTIDLVVYPQPNTGNIYYVPNDFDQ